MPDLILGPMLRYLDEHQATVWVETDAPCEVEVLGRRARTFCVEGHHYAIVPIEGLEPGGDYPYEVALDGERRWPARGRSVPAAARSGPIDPSRTAADRVRIVPRGGPAPPAVHAHQGRGRPRPRDRRAVRARASHARARRPRTGRSLLLAIGDQVYVDEDAPADPRVHPLPPRHQPPAGRGGARLRGVHAPLPGVVGRAGDPVAVLDGRRR